MMTITQKEKDELHNIILNEARKIITGRILDLCEAQIRCNHIFENLIELTQTVCLENHWTTPLPNITNPKNHIGKTKLHVGEDIRKRMHNQYDLLRGSLNRIQITDFEDECIRHYQYAAKYIWTFVDLALYQAHAIELPMAKPYKHIRL